MSSISVTPLVPLHERPLGQRVAATIRAELARYDIPQTRVASALGLTQQAVSQKLHGRRPLTLDEIEVIAPMLGMSAAQLLAAAETPPPGGSSRPRLDSNQQPTD